MSLLTIVDFGKHGLSNPREVAIMHTVEKQRLGQMFSIPAIVDDAAPFVMLGAAPDRHVERTGFYERARHDHCRFRHIAELFDHFGVEGRRLTAVQLFAIIGNKRAVRIDEPDPGGLLFERLAIRRCTATHNQESNNRRSPK